jgi:hypothetical protein
MPSSRHYLLARLLLFLPIVACSKSSIENVLIHQAATDVQRHDFPESKSYQVSYRVSLKYPAAAVSDTEFAQLERLGWRMCSDSQQEWESFLDASEGDGKEKTVFQRLSYFRKGESLLTIALRYYADVGSNGRKISAPESQDQYVVFLEDANPDVRKWLQVCSE